MEVKRKFTQGYTFKVLMLAALILMMLIPLAMIRGLINERNWTAQFAETDIMEAWGSELVAAGPMLVVPGIRTEEVRTVLSGGAERVDTVRRSFTLVIMPERLDIRADFQTEIRRRGIFSVPLFSGGLAFAGNFNPVSALAAAAHNEELFLDQAELVIVLSSQQGIRRIERAAWNNGLAGDDSDLFFQPGNRNLGNIAAHVPLVRQPAGRQMGGGIFAALPDLTGSPVFFDISISLQGGRMVRFLPTGQQTHVTVASDWSSPSFQGSFLPLRSDISVDGFYAVWDISYLSRDIPLFWRNETSYTQRNYSASLFGVNFFRAIDTYALNTRATRYAVLFLVVPFLALFLLEMHTKKSIHPVQYLLSGIANVIFYLLLLSLSEQMQFHTAYLIAAFAVATLMTLYSRSLLPSWNKSFYVALAVSLSYILLYAVLNAESFALLIGSIYAFVLVALVMFLTRKMDWYGIGSQKTEAVEKITEEQPGEVIGAR